MSGGAGTDVGSGAVPCANHPRVETWVRCSDCGKPICPDCMVQSAVGIKCRDCAKLPSSARVTLTPNRAGRAVGAGLAVATGCGIVLALGGAYTAGFFTFILAYVVGLLVGRTVLRASGHYRAESTAWIAAGCAVWAYAVPAVVFAIAVGGPLQVGGQGLGMLIAGFFAYREAG